MTTISIPLEQLPYGAMRFTFNLLALAPVLHNGIHASCWRADGHLYIGSPVLGKVGLRELYEAIAEYKNPWEILNVRLYYLGPNPQNEAAAIEQSIEKWTILEDTPVNDNGILTCGLCMMYYETSCLRCPVGKARAPRCMFTPYSDWVDAAKSMASPAILKEIAHQERLFLESLRSDG